MIRISIKALINLLLENGHTFTVKKSNAYKDRTVYALMVGNDYPNVSPIVHYSKDEFETSMQEVRDNKQGKVIVLYDTTQDRLLGVSCEILDIVKKAKLQAIQKAFSKPEPKVEMPKLADEFGRQFHTNE